MLQRYNKVYEEFNDLTLGFKTKKPEHIAAFRFKIKNFILHKTRQTQWFVENIHF